MYLLSDTRKGEMIMAPSFFELKEFYIRYLFSLKSEIVVNEELNQAYQEVINRIYKAEDEEEVYKCIVTANVYFDQSMKML